MKGLDWTNERFSRWHTRDTPAWMILGYATQNLWGQIMRKMDRAGVIPLDPDLMPYESIAALLPHAPPLEVEKGIEILLKKGWLVHDKGREYLIDPEFLDREEANMSDAQRQRESRRRRRDKANLELHETSHNVTDPPRYVTESSHNVTEPSHAVTPRHTSSHGVTPSDPSDPAEEKDTVRVRPNEKAISYVHDTYHELKPGWHKKLRIGPPRKTALGDLDRKAISKCLTTAGYTADDLCAALRNVHNSAYHMGRSTPDKKPRLAIRNIFNVNGKVDSVAILLDTSRRDKELNPFTHEGVGF